ncbi:MAG: Lrp/AsnC family transcriptional regulator [Candidatus Woesearchaeota archaeon]
MKIDEKDLAILKELNENSRLSIRDIAKITKLRPSTVHVRITQMIKQGLIEKFTLKLSNEKLGQNFIVFILIKTLEEIPKSAFSHKAVKEVFGITGEYDMMMKLKFKDIVEFNDYLIDFRKKYKIGATVTMVSTITLKEEL